MSSPSIPRFSGLAATLSPLAKAVRADARLYLVMLLYGLFAAELSWARGREYMPWLVAKYAVGWTSTALAAGALCAMVCLLVVIVREKPASPLGRCRQAIVRGATPERAAGLLLYTALAAFMGAFTSVKTLLPELQPFWADRLLSSLGRDLHFGHYTWRLLQPWMGRPVVTQMVEFCYVPVWTALVILVPFWLTVGPAKAALRSQALWAFVLAWIVNGTLLAAFFMSAGPAFYEQLTGDGSRYGELLAYLRAVGAQPYSASVMQSYLWSAYVGQSRELGAGISAFPSMHVTMGVLWALVAWRVNRRLGWIMAAYAVLLVLGSIHLAWHYALDSYFAVPSAIGIWMAAGVIARRQSARRAQALDRAPIVAETG